MSNGLKKARKLADKEKSTEKQSGKQLLLGVLPCQTGGGAHCVAWKGDELYAGEICESVLVTSPPLQPSLGDGDHDYLHALFPLLIPAQAATTAAFLRGHASALANHEARRIQPADLNKNAAWSRKK